MEAPISTWDNEKMRAMFTQAGFDGRWSLLSEELAGKYSTEVTKIHIDLGWVLTSVDFVCPVCQRAKDAIIRPFKKGLLAGLHVHHDHFLDYVVQKKRQFSFFLPDFCLSTILRFPSVPLCYVCNHIDGRIKKKLRIVHPNFSFRPDELACLIEKKFAQKPKIDYDSAKQIWEKEKEYLFWRIAQVDAFSGAPTRSISFGAYKKEIEEVAKRRFFAVMGSGCAKQAFRDFLNRSLSLL